VYESLYIPNTSIRQITHMILGIDGDFLCYFQAHGMQSRGGKLEDHTVQDFTKQALRTINYYSSKMLDNRVSQIIIFFDEGKSWRYDYLNNHGVRYKDRDKTKRELVNFNDYRNHFRNTLIKHKFAVVAVSGYEADDVLHATIKLIPSGEFLIFTGDSDLQQLLSSEKDKEIVIINPLAQDGFPVLRTLHQTKSESTPVNDDFFAEDIPTKFIDNMPNAKYVDPAERLYIKMISGDSTDTIPSAFQYMDGDKKKTVGETRAESFHRLQIPTPTLSDIKQLFVDRELRIEFAQKILSFAKLKAFNKINDFEKGLYRNLKCIMLDDIIYESHEIDKLRMMVNEQMKPSPGTDLGKIFRGTEYDFLTNYYKY